MGLGFDITHSGKVPRLPLLSTYANGSLGCLLYHVPPSLDSQLREGKKQAHLIPHCLPRV